MLLPWLGILLLITPSGTFSYLWYPLVSFGIFSLPLISPLPTSFIYRSPNSKLSDGPLCLPFIPLSVYLFVFISKTAKLFFTFSLCPFPFPSNVNKPKKKARAHTHTHIHYTQTNASSTAYGPLYGPLLHEPLPVHRVQET